MVRELRHMNTGKNRSTYRLYVIAAVLLLAVIWVLSTPVFAYALNTAQCTARPNASEGNDILGGTVTRVKYEAQLGEEESLKSISIIFPEGTTFGLDDTRVTHLSGEDLMDRTFIPASATAEGTTLHVELDEPLAEGAYFRIEIYDVVFPTEGGVMPLTGTYTLSNGTQLTIDDIPALNIKGITLSGQIASYLEEQPWVQKWNENKFLRLFLNPPILVKSFPIVAKGFLMALAIVLIAFPLAIPFGLILSLMRMSKFAVLRGIASLYVNIIRGTPVFLQIYIAFFGLPLAGITIPPFLLGVIVLAMNSCAYQCEIFRGGIQSISKGQFEASRSLGMNGAQTMMSVIIPQTIRRVIPTMTSEFILLYKDTSLLAAVGVMEVVMYAKTIVASTGSITPYIVAACFYLVVTLPLARLVGILERRLANGDTGASRPKTAKKSKGSGIAGIGSQEQGFAALEDLEEAGLADAMDRDRILRPDAVDKETITPAQMSSL